MTLRFSFCKSPQVVLSRARRSGTATVRASSVPTFSIGTKYVGRSQAFFRFPWASKQVHTISIGNKQSRLFNRTQPLLGQWSYNLSASTCGRVVYDSRLRSRGRGLGSIPYSLCGYSRSFSKYLVLVAHASSPAHRHAEKKYPL